MTISNRGDLRTAGRALPSHWRRVAGGLCLLTALLAGALPPVPARAAAFLAAGGGQTHYETRCDGGACDRRDAGWRGTAGWAFADHWSLEAVWLDNGEFIASDVTAAGVPFRGRAKVRGPGATLGYSLPLGDAFELGVRAGVASMKADFSPGPAPAIAGGRRTTQALYGLTAHWRLSPSWSLRADWDRSAARMNRFDGHVDMLSISVQFNFGERP